MKSLPKILLALLVFAAGVALSGCNTMRGLGQDIENAGESIQNVGN